jgi:hypothetical protein
MRTNGTAPLDGRGPTPTKAVVSTKVDTAQMKTSAAGLLRLSRLLTVAIAGSPVLGPRRST